MMNDPDIVYRGYFLYFNLLFMLACADSSLDLCPAPSLPMFGDTRRVYPLIWRFLPAIDPQVDLFFSRDLDSRISAR